jgi:LPXTG-motif cell wall-anchored protein
MKRYILAGSTMFLLTAGAAMAQNPLNTTAPGPTQEKLPGQTNNDLPNPGHPIAAPTGVKTQPVTENGTTEGTAAESMQRDQTGTTGSMGTTTGTMDNSTSTTTTTTTTGMNDTTGTSTTHVRAHRLPRTGSEMPLVALLGLTSLAGFAVLRASRNA